jgi:hypothetical protein
MMTMLKNEGDPRALAQPEAFDPYKYTGGRNKGYETWLKQQESGALAELKSRLEEAAKTAPAKGKGKKGKASAK